MQWEDLTVPKFHQAVVDCQGVGILPIAVIEPHGTHLPLGQDIFACRWTACRAAEAEPAIVFPFYPWGINHESAHISGAIVIRRELVMAMLENICDEMGRNGLRKIVILSGHGGNRFMLPLFVQTLTEKRKDYCVYLAQIPSLTKEEEGLLETSASENGHAGELETSTAMHIHGHLVDMSNVLGEHNRLTRLGHLQDAKVYTTMDWHSMYPTMHTGDAMPASPDKGRTILERRVRMLTAVLRAVKDDTLVPQLMEQFLAAQQHPHPPK